jgi:hypothetical protein
MPGTTPRTVAVVDLDAATGRPSPTDEPALATLRQVLGLAAADSGLGWESLGAEDRGDGVLLVPGPEVPPTTLVGTFVTALDAQLQLRAEGVRARMAVDLDTAFRDDGCWVGDAVATVFRLVDTPLLSRVLDRAERARAVVATSSSFFENVVREDRTLDPSVFAPAAVDDDGLPTVTTWVRVPGYSGPPGVERRAPQCAAPRDDAAARRPEAGPAHQAPVITVNGNVGGDVVGGDKISYYGNR